MKIGMVEQDLSVTNLNFLKAIGVSHVLGNEYRDFGYDTLGYWDAELVSDAKRHVESYGLKLDMLALPLHSHSVDESDFPGIILGTPERDAEIERLNRCIRAAGKASIEAVQINFKVLPVMRTEPVVGRGGAILTAFDIDKYKAPPTIAGQITAEQMWERISYFVDRVIPVAEEAGVRVACHPNDPAIPLGMGMDDRVLGTLDGLKKYCELSPSRYHGLNFCQGCMEESGLSKDELVDGIHYFGTRKRLFLVHFRTIRGRPLHFREAFIDEGQMDLMAAVQAYQDIGYEHMIVPDHYPQIPGDNNQWATKAYAVGYIKALIRATGGETE